jgi:hypothetical protein
MNDINEKLALCKGVFDIIFDPEVGSMELQEIGIQDRLEYNKREKYAYAQGMDIPTLQQFIIDTAENLGIREEETEVEDRLTGKVVKTYVEDDPLKGGTGFWVTFWYDSGTGTLHRQGKMEMYIKPHSKEEPERFEFYDIKKNVWVEKIAGELKQKYKAGVELDQLNDYIKKKKFLWLLEEILVERYDLWDFMDDINQKIVG